LVRKEDARKVLNLCIDFPYSASDSQVPLSLSLSLWIPFFLMRRFG
jgi:hypothetical protein